MRSPLGEVQFALTTRVSPRYDLCAGDVLIPKKDKFQDFDRLERSVVVLIDKYRHLQSESARLGGAIKERDRRIADLEGEILALNQRRQDVGKRVDELISRVEHLDAHLDAVGD